MKEPVQDGSAWRIWEGGASRGVVNDQVSSIPGWLLLQLALDEWCNRFIRMTIDDLGLHCALSWYLVSLGIPVSGEGPLHSPFLESDIALYRVTNSAAAEIFHQEAKNERRRRADVSRCRYAGTIIRISHLAAGTVVGKSWLC